jgi:hypothetical protein
LSGISAPGLAIAACNDYNLLYAMASATLAMNDVSVVIAARKSHSPVLPGLRHLMRNSAEPGSGAIHGLS